MHLTQPTQRVLLALALALLPVVARAEPGVVRPARSVTPTDPEEDWIARRGVWYGSQTLGCDALSVLVFSAALGGGTPLAVAGVSGFVLGAPIVHMVHENAWVAGVSLAMRLGFPVLGAWIGTKLDRGIGGSALGGVIGIVAASAVDAKFLAYEANDSPPSTRRRAESGIALPLLAVGMQSNQMTLSLGGRF